MKKTLLIILSLVALFWETGIAIAREPVYPAGLEMPLGLYSTIFDDLVTTAWNMGHSYQFVYDMKGFVSECEQADLLTHASLSEGQNESQIADTVTMLDATKNIGWWDFPEEQRWWIPAEMAVVANYSAWTRNHDPHPHPNYMYIPGHYDQQDIEHYVDYLDIVPASCYTTYMSEPHAWVRWRLESTLAAIHAQGKQIGPDFMHGQKTVIGIAELFGTSGRITADGAYHDFWSILASGAQGVFIYSHYHRQDDPRLQAAWDSYCLAAHRLTASPDRIDQAVLFGTTNVAVQAAVVEGPARTTAFTPPGHDSPIDYPAINVLAKRRSSALYLIVVNSAEQSVAAKIKGLPNRTAQVQVLFENRTLPVSQSAFQDKFAPLGVHLYKIRLRR